MASKIVIVKKYFSKFFHPDFIFRRVFIPLIILTLYTISFSYILPEGVNKVFADKFWKISLLFTMVSGIVGLVLIKYTKTSTSIFKKSPEKLSFSDSILILLPLTPVVQYILSNQNILSIWQSFYVFGFFVLFSILFIIIIPSIFGFIGSIRTLMIIGLAFTFTIINMAALSNYFSWFEVGNMKIQLLIFSVIFLISWFFYDLNYKKFLYVIITIYFVSNTFSYTFISINNSADKIYSFTENKLFALTSHRTPISTPNIYLLVYDSYVSNETMLSYGINNGAQEEFLKKLGFKLYPSTYSIGSSSLRTMSRVLNASTEYYGNTRRAVSGDGVTQNILKRFDYQTYGVFDSDHFLRNTVSTYDYTLPDSDFPSPKLLSEAILMGEFRFNFGFDKFPRKPFLTAKESFFKVTTNYPKFVYMHSKIPGHSQNSGKCRANETELFQDRLKNANIDMNQDAESIVKNDPGAIIIVAGDHGPYLTKNCTATSPDYNSKDITRLDIQDRFGTFLAIRWPTSNFEKYDQITILQDLFPSIFAYILNDEKILNTKVEPKTIGHDGTTSGAAINKGVIYGGINDGEPLFIKDR